MPVALKNKFPPSPFKREFRFAVIASLVFHALLGGMIFWTPYLGSHKVITVPRSYTVNLVSLPPELLQKITVKPGVTAPPALPAAKEKGAAIPKIAPAPVSKAKEAVPLKATEEKITPPAPTMETKPPAITSPSVAKVQSGDYAGWSSVGAVAVDAETFAFAYYLGMVQNKISSNWSPPGGVLKLGQAEKATVYFKILRNGQIQDLSIENSSGIFFFDQSALRAVSRSVPLPPLPVGYGEDSLGVHFDFELKGEQG